ncbi:MAG TPA: fatty acyl-CoA synthetase [Rhodopila sp.]|uniref:fatty acyl-CoA synthetase n=1 Tax=Rhodopila sp. TaxID=2480087 RepID=UPI002C5C47AA|nr:fatty acyl-CoA synthetase [Rhodopila sp.]HVY16623.1 fatty acyl-CoA synthetase [Rhodopila sp.]
MDPIHRNTVGDALRRAARVHRDAPALTFQDRAWSFRALDEGAGRLARHFADLGLRPGDRIAAYGRNSDAYFLAWLGCARGGFVHVPVNYALTGAELSYIIEQSGARAVLVAASLQGNLPGIAIEHTVLLEDLLATARDISIPPVDMPDITAETLGQIVYTSGTTAAPKGAMMTHGAMLAQYYSVIHHFEYKRTDRALAALPLYHTAQTHAFTMPQLLVGAHTTLIEAPAPDQVLALVESERITSFFAPPTVWISLLRHPDFATRDLTSLKNIYYGASIMPVPVLHELRERLPGARPYNAYGQTEIAPCATVLAPEDHDARPASCGRPVLNVETRVVDPDMNDVPPGTHGEIVHRSPQLLTGYWNKPKETEEAFAGGWFHSGDVGYFDEDGYLYIVDRIRDVINTGGVLVASREVEEVLFTHAAVSEVAVVGLPDEKWIEAVTAFVTLRPGHDVDEAVLIAHARQHLAPFKLPKRVVFVETLPRNTAGKLLKRELRKQYG